MPPPCRGIALSAEGQAAIVPSPDGLQVLRVEVATGRVLSAAPIPTGVTGLELSPDGALAAAVSGPGRTVTLLREWDLAPAGVLVTGAGPGGMAFSPDGRRLYVACGGSREVQAFDLARPGLLKATGFVETPVEVEVLGDGSLVAVGLEEAAEVRILEGETLQPVGSIPVPPGTTALHHHAGILLIASDLSDTLTVADAATFEVIGTFDVGNPRGISSAPGLGGLAGIAAGGTRVEFHETLPSSPFFGRKAVALFTGEGMTGFATSSRNGALRILGSDRAKMIGAETFQLLNPPRLAGIRPCRGVPGTLVSAEGSFGNPEWLHALFFQEERRLEAIPAARRTRESFEAEVPLEAEPGPLEMWVSESTPQALESGRYLASWPARFEALGPLEALEELAGELERRAGTGEQTPATALAFRQAAGALRSAKDLLGNLGDVRAALGRIAEAFELMDAAEVTGSGSWRGNRGPVEIVQYVVYSKLRAVRESAGPGHPAVVRARQDFEAARALLGAGRWKEALEGFRRAFEGIEEACGAARKLFKRELLGAIREAVEGILEVEGEVRTRSVDEARSSSRRKALREVSSLISGSPSRILRGTLVADVLAPRLMEAVDRAGAVVEALRRAGEEGLAGEVAAALCRMIERTAEAVERNVGPFDGPVLAARRHAAEAGWRIRGGAVMEALGILREAVSALGASPSSRGLRVLNFTTPTTTTAPWNPTCRIRYIEPVFIGKSGGGEEVMFPRELKIRTEVRGIPSGQWGYLVVTVERKGGGQVVRHLEVVAVYSDTPQPVEHLWDGRDQEGNLLPFKGKARQETFVARARFYPCDDSVRMAEDTELIVATRSGGLVIKRSHAEKRMSRPGQEATEQFRAYVYEPRGGDLVEREVTEEAIWTLDNEQVGAIDPNNGLFRSIQEPAENPAPRQGTVSATYEAPGGEILRGEARIVVVPREGGIVPGMSFLAVGGTEDFQVYQIGENGEPVEADDGEYEWDVGNRSVGVVSGFGIFGALGNGETTVTARKGGKTYTAQVKVGEVDLIEVLSAPGVMPIPSAGVFQVQVFRNNQPVDGVEVLFGTSSGAEATVNPRGRATGGGGLAETGVGTGGTPSASIGSTKLEASAGGVAKVVPITVATLNLALEGVPPDEQGPEPPGKLGGLVWVNNDDDNGDGVRDLFRPGIDGPSDLEDLERVTVTVMPVQLKARVRARFLGRGRVSGYDLTGVPADEVSLRRLDPLESFGTETGILGVGGRRIGIEGTAGSDRKSDVRVEARLVAAPGAWKEVALTVGEVDVIYQPPNVEATDGRDPALRADNVTDYVCLIRPTGELGEPSDMFKHTLEGGVKDMGWFLQIRDATRRGGDPEASVSLWSQTPGGADRIDVMHPPPSVIRLAGSATFRSDILWAVSDRSLKGRPTLSSLIATPGAEIVVSYQDLSDLPRIRKPWVKKVRVVDAHLQAHYGKGMATRLDQAMVASVVFETNNLDAPQYLAPQAAKQALRAYVMDPRPAPNTAVLVRSLQVTPPWDSLALTPPNGGVSSDFWVVVPNIATPPIGPVPAPGPHIGAGGHALDDGIISLQGQPGMRLHTTHVGPAYFTAERDGTLIGSVTRVTKRFTVPIVSVNVDGKRSSTAGASRPSAFTEPCAERPMVSIPMAAVCESSKFNLTDENDLLVRVTPGDLPLAYEVVDKKMLGVSEKGEGGIRTLTVEGDNPGITWVRARYGSKEGQVLSEFMVEVLKVPDRRIIVGFHFIAETLPDGTQPMHTQRFGAGDYGNPVQRAALEANIDRVVTPLLNRMNTIWRPYGIEFEAKYYGRRQGRIVAVARDLDNPNASVADRDFISASPAQDVGADINVFFIQGIAGATAVTRPAQRHIFVADDAIYGTISHESGHALGVTEGALGNPPGTGGHRWGTNDYASGVLIYANTNDDPDTDMDERRLIELMYPFAVTDSDLDGLPDEGSVEIDIQIGEIANRTARNIAKKKPGE